jgi:hypothetical protein
VASGEPSRDGVVNPFNRAALKRKRQLLRIVVEVARVPSREHWAWERRAHDSTAVYGFTLRIEEEMAGEPLLQDGDQIVRINGATALSADAEVPQVALDRLFGGHRVELQIFRPSEFERQNQTDFAEACSAGNGKPYVLFVL